MNVRTLRRSRSGAQGRRDVRIDGTSKARGCQGGCNNGVARVQVHEDNCSIRPREHVNAVNFHDTKLQN